MEGKKQDAVARLPSRVAATNMPPPFFWSQIEQIKQYQMNIDRGVPAIAILDRSGKLLFSDKGGEFEAARRMAREDLIAFLQKWAPAAKK